MPTPGNPRPSGGRHSETPPRQILHASATSLFLARSWYLPQTETRGTEFLFYLNTEKPQHSDIENSPGTPAATWRDFMVSGGTFLFLRESSQSSVNIPRICCSSEDKAHGTYSTNAREDKVTSVRLWPATREGGRATGGRGVREGKQSKRQGQRETHTL